jgi:FkbM family methyltransferase
MNRSTGFIKPLNGREGLILFNGFPSIIPLDDTAVSEEVKNVYMKPRKGDVVVDIGAHYGFYTLNASRLVGSKGMVLSFEPHPDNYRGLLMNMRLNDVKNVKTFNTALGDFDGRAKLYVQSHSGGHSIFFRSGNHISVELAKLDTFMERLALERVDLIKIDAEGAELSILRGAWKVIQKFKPNLSIAAYHYTRELSDLMEWLRNRAPYAIMRKDNKFLQVMRPSSKEV